MNVDLSKNISTLFSRKKTLFKLFSPYTQATLVGRKTDNPRKTYVPSSCSRATTAIGSVALITTPNARQRGQLQLYGKMNFTSMLVSTNVTTINTNDDILYRYSSSK